MDLAKQRIVMAKGVVKRDCDIWQWAGMGNFEGGTATLGNIAYSHMSNCEYICSKEPNCEKVVGKYYGGWYSLHVCYMRNTHFSQITGAVSAIYEMKYHFCYGK